MGRLEEVIMKKPIDEKLNPKDIDLEAAKRAATKIKAAHKAAQRVASPRQRAENKRRERETKAMSAFTQTLERERHCRKTRPNKDQEKAYQKINEEAKAYAAQIGADAVEISEPAKG